MQEVTGKVEQWEQDRSTTYLKKKAFLKQSDHDAWTDGQTNGTRWKTHGLHCEWQHYMLLCIL